jgi:hypothetical protein
MGHVIDINPESNYIQQSLSRRNRIAESLRTDNRPGWPVSNTK